MIREPDVQLNLLTAARPSQVPSLVSVSDLCQQTWKQEDRTEIFVSSLVSFFSFIIFHSPTPPFSSLYFLLFLFSFQAFSFFPTSLFFYFLFDLLFFLHCPHFLLIPLPIFTPSLPLRLLLPVSSHFSSSNPFSSYFFHFFPLLFLISLAFLFYSSPFPSFLLLIISALTHVIESSGSSMVRFRNKCTNPLRPSESTQCNWACSLVMFRHYNFEALHFFPQANPLKWRLHM
jgi:hypothetical protein